MRTSTLVAAGLAAAALASAAAVVADPMGMPARRAGQWKIVMTGVGQGGGGMTMSTCVDPAREKSFTPYTGPAGRGGADEPKCSKRDVHAIPGGWAFDSVCMVMGRQTHSSGRVTGDFRTHYHMDETSDGGGQVRHVSMDGTWVGPCSAGGGQTVTLPDGRVIHVPPH